VGEDCSIELKDDELEEQPSQSRRKNMAKKKQVFIIQTGVTKSGNPRCRAYCSEAPFKKAVKDLHKILRSEDPKNWSPNWQDLLKDIENGNQTCYEVDSIMRNDGLPIVV
jgi:hypothetical protein